MTNISYYSQYPTDDNKYQCRTGPFEGFFVSSVEFCKHVKFEDKKDNNRKDNRTGNQGLPGPQGPPGLNGTQGPQAPAGPQDSTGLNGTNGVTGPSGITQLNATNIYRVQGPTNNNTNPIPGFATSIAECQPGDVLLNGGLIANGRSPILSEALPLDNVTNHLPIGYIVSII